MSHLQDPNNTSAEIDWFAEAPILDRPNDPALIHLVLDLTRKRSDDKLTSEIVRILGLARTRNTEALNFIAACLSRQRPKTHYAAVDAVSRLDRDLQAQFAADLSLIVANPDEDEPVRAMAQKALASR